MLSRLVLKIVVMARQEARGTHARGKSKEGLGDLTFLYTGWFYYVHLLRLLRTYYPKLPVGNRELLTGQRAKILP